MATSKVKKYHKPFAGVDCLRLRLGNGHSYVNTTVAPKVQKHFSHTVNWVFLTLIICLYEKVRTHRLGYSGGRDMLERQ